MASLLKPCTSWDIVDNWAVDDESSNQVYDLYVPKNNGTVTNPLIVWVHGGAWIGGDETPAGMPPGVDALIRRGFALASVRYRLSTEARWPAQLIDTLAVIRDLRARAAPWRLYAPKIGIWGSSAGGHLAAMAAVASTDPEFNQGNWDNTSSAVEVGCCDFPPTDFASWVATPGCETLDDPGQFINTLFGGTVADNLAEANAASPALRVTASSAPLLIRHGTADTLVPVQQSRKLRDAYNAAGVAVALTEFSGAGHGTPSSTFYSAAAVKGVGDMFDAWLRP